jgi:hypothetical protein
MLYALAPGVWRARRQGIARAQDEDDHTGLVELFEKEDAAEGEEPSLLAG